MSNHPSNNLKSRLLRRGLAGILSLALILGLIPSTIVSAHAASWADSYVQTLVDWGVMRGDISGNMAPDRSITRAEFVAMMNRAYGYTKLGGHPFTDVRSRDWYNQDIDIAYNIGYFKGTSPTTASPNGTLTREQAAVLLSRNMMLQETVGETLGFSDSRTLNDWSRGLIGAAAKNGIINGYADGSFQPRRNITRGEVAAMLVRAIGTPIQTPGDHALGNVYGNVTVNTSGVNLRDGVIAGNLYLTGGIDLGDVLLENVTVLGEIIVSGGGESNSSQSSIIMRNVVADSMIVDSIGSQFVTLRAEGNTDIPTTVVRTNAYVDDSSLPGYGLSHITLDGENGALYQLAGGIKEVLNKTPGSDMQFVQGTANKVTVDEYATGSSVLVDGDAVVNSLNLDTATKVTGTGDITNLNVGAAGSTVEQLPDKIDIRPGIVADVNGSSMNSTQAAESSTDPKLLAGYPAVKSIAPTSATLVFKTNKTGTIYWAVSAVADGSVKEADLLEPPTYGGNVLKSGTIKATAANKEFTAAVTGLTRAGSYYVTAMLVDGRDQHSPIKVTSFSTPDDTVPAFVSPYPTLTKNSRENVQFTVMTNKSCLLYYAVLSKGAPAPTAAEFKSAAIPGNWGYGSMSVTKSVTTPIQVNRVTLEEKTDYVLYMWLTDHDGAKSSSVVSRSFTTPDETRPKVTSIMQTDAKANSMAITYTLDEPGSLIWAVVSEATHDSAVFLPYTEAVPDASDPNRGTLRFKGDDPTDDKDSSDALAAKVKLESGSDGNVIAHRSDARSPFTINVAQQYTALGTSFVLYYMGKDSAGNYSKTIGYLKVNTLDNTAPKFVEQTFNRHTGDVNQPLANTDVTLAFSESIMGNPNKTENVFKTLYDAAESARVAYKNLPTDANKTAYDNARKELGDSLSDFFTMWCVPSTGDPYEVTERTSTNENTANLDWTVDWRNARITLDRETGRFLLTLPTVVEDATSKDYTVERYYSALNLDSGSTYYFQVRDIYDLGSPMPLVGANPQNLPRFTTVDVQVFLRDGKEPAIVNATGPDSTGKIVDLIKDGEAVGSYANSDNDPARIDYHFQMKPQDVKRADEELYWDMLIGFSHRVEITIYSRHINDNNTPVPKAGDTNTYTNPNDIPWEKEGTVAISRGAYASMSKEIWDKLPNFAKVNEMLTTPGGADDWRKEFAIHVDQLGTEDKFTAFNEEDVTMTVAISAGDRIQLRTVTNASLMTAWSTLLSGNGNTARRIEEPQPYQQSPDFTDNTPPEIQGTPRISDIKDTSARVTLSLSQTGTIYYLAVPVSDIWQAGNTSIKLTDSELTENVIMGDSTTTPVRPGVTQNYDFPLPFSTIATSTDNKPDLKDVRLMLNDPDRSAHASTDLAVKDDLPLRVYQPDFDYFTNSDKYDRYSVKKGNANGGKGETITIDFSDLSANTVYMLLLLPSAQSTAPNATNSVIHCYRFTTNMYDVPKLLLERGQDNATVIASKQDSQTARMRYFVVPRGNEDASGTGTGGMRFDDPFVATGAKARAKESFTTEFPSRFPNADLPSPYTVLDAMATPLFDGANTYLGTVFDLYALDSIKSTYAGFVRSISSAGGNSTNIVDKSGQNSLVLNPSYTIGLDKKIEGGQQFTVVAIASRDDKSTNFAFCAYYPVEVQDNNPPMIIAADPYGAKNSADNSGISEAYITLSFDKGLHRQVEVSTNKFEYQPIDNCGPTVHATGNPTANGKTYWTIGDSYTSPDNIISVVSTDTTHPSNPTATRSITLKISSLTGGGTTFITFNKYGTFTDGDRHGTNRDPLRIGIKAINVNAGLTNPDGTPMTPKWEPSITTITSGWGKGTTWDGTVK